MENLSLLLSFKLAIDEFIRILAWEIPILFYFAFSKNYFIIISYHFIIFSTFQNYIFIKILFFNLSLLFFSNHHFFLDLVFRFPTVIFFPFFLPQPLAPVQHTKPHTHTHTHDTLINLSKPITTQSHTHTYKHKPSYLQQSHTHTNHQTSWSQQRRPHPPPKPPINKSKQSIRNPRRRFETQAVENTQKNVDDQLRKTSKIPKPPIRNPRHRFSKIPRKMPMINPKKIENTQKYPSH